MQDFIEDINGQHWYLDSQREAEIIDGQQRITTVVLTYAALQYQLHLLEEADPEQAAIGQAIADIQHRLCFEDGDSGFSLILRRSFDEDSDRWSLANNVTFDPGKDDNITRVLRANSARAHGGVREPCNATHINRWLAEQALQQGGERTAGQLDWLLGFLHTLDTRVLWTTTLTPRQALALQTFVSYNMESTKVPLAPL